MNHISPDQGERTADTRQPQPTEILRHKNKIGQVILRFWSVLCISVKTFFRIDGAQRAGAFAFNAFFSLFPAIILFVTIASFFVDQDKAAKAVIAYMEAYVPIGGQMHRYVFDGIAGVVQSRALAGAAACLILAWVAFNCLTTLICATNHAWDVAAYKWWRLPLKSLLMLGITAGGLVVGIAVPVLMKMVEGWFFTESNVASWVYRVGTFLTPLVVVFFGLSVFYRIAPRRPTRFSEVWWAALWATILLRSAQSLFVIYLRDFATLNVFYGAFGGIIAFQMWVYITGCVIVFGACLCAGQAQLRSLPNNINGA